MTGSCLCKRVSLTIKDPSKILDGGVEICRCTDCRQFTGALAGAFVTSPTDNVSITGENEIKNYAIKSDAGNTLTRHWCGHCGSSLYDTTSRSLGKRMTIHGGELQKLGLGVEAMAVDTKATSQWAPCRRPSPRSTCVQRRSGISRWRG